MGKHLTYEQRCQIKAPRDAGWGQAAIASAVGTSQSAISRELVRNAGNKPRKMAKDVIAVIKARLCREQLSPQQISGWMAATQLFSVSHECIYQHIWADKEARGSLYKQLRRSGKTYKKRSNKLASMTTPTAWCGSTFLRVSALLALRRGRSGACRLC